MPQIRVQCPECDAALRVEDDPAMSDVECPKCGTRFGVPEKDPIDDRPLPKKRKKKPAPKANTALIAGLAVGVLLLIGGGVAAVMAMRPGKKAETAAAPAAGAVVPASTHSPAVEPTPGANKPSGATPLANAPTPKTTPSAPKSGSGKVGLEIGDTAMEITGEDINGKPFKLSDYRGKVVVVDFWGFWCPHCVAMFDHERELVKRLDGKPFALIGVNSDRDREKTKASVVKENLPWRSFWNGGSPGGPIAREWKVQGWPSIWVIDADGVIRYRNVRGPKMDQAVNALLQDMGKL